MFSGNNLNDNVLAENYQYLFHFSTNFCTDMIINKCRYKLIRCYHKSTILLLNNFNKHLDPWYAFCLLDTFDFLFLCNLEWQCVPFYRLSHNCQIHLKNIRLRLHWQKKTIFYPHLTQIGIWCIRVNTKIRTRSDFFVSNLSLFQLWF